MGVKKASWGWRLAGRRFRAQDVAARRHARWQAAAALAIGLLLAGAGWMA